MAERKKSTFQRLQDGRLNRKQRKELAQRLAKDDPGLEIVHRDAAGIDIGNASHFVAVPAGRDAEPVQEFGAWTSALLRMAEWLKKCGIRTVVMQSTGVYWQERCAGVPVVEEAAYLRAAAEFVPAARADSSIADGVAAAGPGGERCGPDHTTDAEGAHEDERAFGQRDQ
jgi:hypothetical protein